MSEIRIIEVGSAYPFIRFERALSEDSSDRGPFHWRAMVADQILVRLDREASMEDLYAILDGIGGSIRKTLSEKNRLYVVGFSDFQSPAHMPILIQELNRMPEIVSYAEPDFLIHSLVVPNDPKFSSQWSLDAENAGLAIDYVDIGALDGWDVRSLASDVLVAVADSGTKLDHPDLVSNLWTNEDDPINGVDDDGNGYIDDYFGINAIDANKGPFDDNGHGTAVAGVVGARGDNGLGIAGVAWGVQLMSVKFLNEDGFGTTSDAIEAIDYAISKEADIINASWGSRELSYSLERAIERAYEANILFVAAAGNDSRDLDSNESYPASFDIPNVLSVAATDRSGLIASYSNYGRNSVHTAAPGSDIISLSNEDDGSTPSNSGTSLAAPHVSGIAAIVMAHFGREPVEVLKNRLVLSSREISSLLHRVQSNGVVNLNRALKEQTNVPENDDFENAATLSPDSAVLIGNASLATLEDGEPLPRDAQDLRTVWYSLRLDRDALVLIESGLRHSVYEGSTLDNLQEASTASFNEYLIEANKTYYIQVYVSDNYPRYELRISIPQLNDDFENAIPIVQNEFDTRGSNVSGTRQPSEPSHGSGSIGRSSWWRYICSESGYLTISTAGSETDTILAVYQGESLSGLELLASNDNANPNTTSSQVALDVREGEVYYIAIDSEQHPAGRIRLSGSFLVDLGFVAQPRNQPASLGDSVSFYAKAAGPIPISYQWIKDGNPIPGATETVYSVANVSQADFGTYVLRASSDGDSILSEPALLFELGPAPVFLHQPIDTRLPGNSEAALYAVAQSPTPPDFQWYRNGSPIEGANESKITVSASDQRIEGVYFLRASNRFGQADSRPVQVSIIEEGEPLIVPIDPTLEFEFVDHVIWCNEKFYAFGPDSGSQVHPNALESVDGYTWRTSKLMFAIGGSPVFSAAATETRIATLIRDGRIAVYDTGTESYRTQSLGDFSLDTVVAGNGVFVASSETGRVYRSVDGSSWETVLDTNGRTEVAFANGFFLAAYKVQSLGWFLLRSLDGREWENIASSSFPGNELRGNGKSFSSGEYFSRDGVEWIESRSDMQEYTPIVYAGDRHFNISHGNRVFTSSDGIAWDLAGGIANTESRFLKSIAYGNGTFVLGLHRGRILAAASLEDSIAVFDHQVEVDKLPQFVNGSWIAKNRSTVLVSVDGIEWNEVATDLPLDDEHSVHFGNGTYVYGSPSGIYVGPTLESMSQLPNSEGAVDNVLAFGNGRFLGVKEGAYLISSDGETWSPIAQTLPEMFDVVFGLGKFVGLAENGVVLRSEDGITWASFSFNTDLFSLSAILATDTEFVISMRDGDIFTSVDGSNWQKAPSIALEQHQSLGDLGFSDGTYFVRVGTGVYSSADLSSWTELASESIAEFSHGVNATFARDSDDRLFRIVQSVYSPPFIDGSRIAKEYRSAPGEPIVLEVEAHGLDGAVETVELLVDGEVVDSATTPLSSFTWIPEGVDRFILEIRANDENGRFSNIQTVVDSSSNPVVDLLPFETPLDVSSVVAFRGIAYAISGGGVLYRTETGLDWELARTFNNERYLELYSNDRALLLKAPGGYYVSGDGYNWSYVSDPRIHKVEVWGDWLVLHRNNPSRQLFSKDGFTWKSGPGANSIQARIGSQFLVGDEWSVYQVIQPGGGARPAEFPPGLEPNRFFSGQDEIFVEFYDIDFRSVLYQTPDFVSWERIDTDHLEPNDRDRYSLSMVDSPAGLFMLQKESRIYYSDDLIDWKSIGGLDYYTLFRFEGELFANSIEGIYRHSEALGWEKVGAPLEGIDRIVQGGKALFGWHSSGPRVYNFASSQDGFNWNESVFWEGGRDVTTVAFGNGKYIARSLRTGATYVSQDGSNWVSHADELPIDNPVVFGNGMFLAPYYSGPLEENFNYATSSDGFLWTPRHSPEFERDQILDIRHIQSAGRFVAIDGGDGYYHSENGIDWIRNSIAAGKPHASMTIVADRIYINCALPGEERNVYTTTDGINWDFSSGFQAQFHWNGYFCGKIIDSQMHVSASGVESEVLEIPLSSRLRSVALIGERLYASSRDETIYTEDGEIWFKSLDQDIATDLTTITVNGIQFIFDESINHFSESDLVLTSIELSEGERSIGDIIECIVEIKNVGKDALALNGIKIRAKLTDDGAWSSREGIDLEPWLLPDLLIEPGESLVLNADFVVPPNTVPGNFDILAQLNSTQALKENSYANNYAISEGLRLSIPAKLLTANVEGMGDLEILPDRSEFARGEIVTILAQPSPRYKFSSWQGVDDFSSNSAEILMNDNRTVTATFDRVYTPEFRFEGNGSVSVDPDEAPYDGGEILQIEARADVGWEFHHWSGHVDSVDEVLSFAIEDDVLLVAVFKQSYESWSLAEFGEADPVNEEIREPGADPDGDGRINLFEFLMAADPNTESDGAVIEYEVLDGLLRLVYRKSNSVSGLELLPVTLDGSNSWSTNGVANRLLIEGTSSSLWEATVPVGDSSPSILGLKAFPVDN